MIVGDKNSYLNNPESEGEEVYQEIERNETVSMKQKDRFGRKERYYFTSNTIFS